MKVPLACIRRLRSAPGIEVAPDVHPELKAIAFRLIPIDRRERFSSVAKPLFIADCHVADPAYELFAHSIAQAIDQPRAPEERFPHGRA